MGEGQKGDSSRLSSSVGTASPTRSGRRGESVRNWRRRVAAAADRVPEPQVRTCKFPLELELPESMLVESTALHETLEGVGPGSLLTFLVTLHLAGFRLFDSVARAHAWMRRDAYGNERFRQLLAEAVGEPVPGVDPEQIDLFLRSPLRRRPEFSAEAISHGMQLRFALAARVGPPSPMLRQLCDRMGGELFGRFDDWAAMYRAPRLAKHCIDAALAQFARDLPSVNVDLQEPAGPAAPIAFDAGLVLQESWPEDSAAGLQLVLARAARHAHQQGRAFGSDAFTAIAQDYVVSRLDNALSWLFNRGLAYFRDASPGQVAEDFGAPVSAHAALARLAQAAREVPALPPLLDAPDYASFRRRFGRRLRIWIANALNRLGEIGYRLDAAADGERSRLPQPVRAAHASLCEELRGAIARLQGTEPGASWADLGSVDTVTAALDDLEAGMIKGRWLGLPKIAGAVQEPAGAAELAAALNRLVALQTGLIGALGSLLPEPMGALLKAREQREAKRMPIATKQLVRSHALRRLLHELLALARTLSPPLRDVVHQAFIDYGVVTDRRLLNRLFVNRQGAVFLPPRSSGRHLPVKMDERAAGGSNWLALLGTLDGLADRFLRAHATAGALADLMAIRTLRLRWLIDGCPEALPGAELRAKLAQLAGAPDSVLPPISARELAQARITRGMLRAVAGEIGDALSPLIEQASAGTWVLRHSFMRSRVTQPLYVAKDRTWQPPLRYWQAPGAIGESARRGLLGAPGCPVHAPRLLEGLLQAGSFDEPAVAVLRQLPHDWYLRPGLRGPLGCQVTGLALADSPLERKGLHLERFEGAARLIGPGQLKAPLERMLGDPRVTAGDATLIFEWRYAQRLSCNEQTGELMLERSFEGCRVEVAIPVTDGSRPAEPVRLVDRMIALDLGERRVAWAVFDLREFARSGCLTPAVDPITGQSLVGSIAVPVMAAFSRSTQSRAAGGSGSMGSLRMNWRLRRRREHVVAGLCRCIEALCREHQAFPLLEALQVSFVPGARQSAMVHASVVRRYAFSPVQWHLARRREHWFGAEQWTHPYLRSVERDAMGRQRSAHGKPLRLFPGTVIGAAGTSQTCPQCGRNPIAALRDGPARVEVGEGGLVKVRDGALRIARAAAAREPLGCGRWPLDEVLRHAKASLRRSDPARTHRETRQSRYCCLYADCGCEGHADEFAAINIGRKFLVERLVRPEPGQSGPGEEFGPCDIMKVSPCS